jgi:hypothetical protein
MEPSNPETQPIRFRTRAYADVQRKLQRTYSLTEEQLRLPEELNAQFTTAFAQKLNGEKWQKTLATALGTSHLPNTAIAAINQAATNIMVRYATAMHLRSQLVHKDFSFPESCSDFDRRLITITDRTAILITHVSGGAEAELRQLGLTPLSAHALHGSIIGFITSAYEKVDYHNAGIEPKIGGLRAWQSSPEKRIEIIDDYWRTLAGLLSKDYKKSTNAR